MEIDRYQYYAFISYSHVDEKWAKWLHKKLENYRLPNIIRKESGGRIPKHVRPVFRDQTDLGIGSLQQSLRKELEDARYLIVICSPNSAKSEWVNKEIQLFKELGRSERIIPFIVKGTPDAVEEGLQCYPPSLLESEDSILGASLEELKPEEALIKIIASILGLKYDQLYRRHQRRERRNRLLLASVLSFLAVAAIIGTYFYWDYNTIKLKYFVDYTERWGIPEGLFELSSEQIHSRDSHFRFEYRQGKLRKVIHANSAGTPVSVESERFGYRPVIQALYYRGDNSLIDHVDYLDRNGKVLVRNTYSGADLSVTDFTHADKFSTAMTLSGRITSAGSGIFNLSGDYTVKSDIARYLLERDKSGRVAKVRFARDNRNTPVKDADGIFGFAVNRDDLGRETEIIFSNDKGEPWPSHLGILGERYVYDGSGNIVRIEYIDKSSRPAYNNERGYASIEKTYDSNGNEIMRQYFDSNGKLCLSKKDQVACLKFQYNTQGFVVNQTFCGKNGEKCLSALGAEVTAEYDKLGNMTKLACLDTNGRPYTGKDGWSSYLASFDEHGNWRTVQYFDTSGNKCLCTQGYAESRCIYDSDWNLTEISFIGVDGSPCLDSDYAIAGFKNVYDEQGRIIRVINIGINGKPGLNNKWYAEIRFQYDSRGNVIDYRYFDENGNPCLCKDDIIAGYEYEYDSYGNLTKAAYYGMDGLPCAGKHWYSEIQYKFDERGNLTDERYFDRNGELCVSDGGYAEIRYLYDAKGNIIEQSYWGTEGERVFTPDYGAIRKMSYDEYGNETGSSYWDTTGKPVLISSGYASCQTHYDDNGNEIEKGYFDVSGNPTSSNEGYARQIIKYNDRNQVTEESYLGTMGELVPVKDGYARIVYNRDEHGRVVKQTSYGVNNIPCMTSGNYCSIVWDYDERGNNIRCIYLGTDDKPCFSASDPGAGISYKYDERNRVIETAKLGLDGKPYLYSFGFAILKIEYDALGNQILIRSFDEDGKPCASWYKYAAIERKYDQKGNITEEHYYGTDGKPCISNEGIAGRVSQYDERNQETARFYLSAESEDGKFLDYRFKYDDSGHCIEKCYINSSNELTCSNKGFAVVQYTFDDRGNTIEEKYLGTDEKLCVNFDKGCAVIKRIYDDRGNIIREDYYMPDGSPCDNSEAASLYTYDAYGRKTGEKYIDKDGNDIPLAHLVCIAEVYPGSPAESSGLLNGDILVELNDWTFFNGSPFDKLCNELMQTISNTKEMKKDLKIVRNDKLMHFQMPSGSMGIRLADYLVSEKRLNLVHDICKNQPKENDIPESP